MSPSSVLRVGTFNILHGMATASASTDPELLADAVRTMDADVLGLQEVDRRQPRSAGVDQSVVVADALGARWHRFVPALHGTPGPSVTWRPASAPDGDSTVGPTYGVALVSRLPVRSWWVKRFPPAPFRLPLLLPGPGPKARFLLIPDEPRVALAAVVERPDGRPFTVVTTHLSFVPGYNVRQLRAISRWVARMPGPVLLVGDFNIPGALPGRLTGWDALATALTYPAHRPRAQLDHLLARGPAVAEAEHVWALPVSDHCALAADVRIS